MAANFVGAEARGAREQEDARSGIPTSVGIEIFSRVLAAGSRRVVVAPYNLVDATHLTGTEAVVEDGATGEAGAVRSALEKALGNGQSAPRPKSRWRKFGRTARRFGNRPGCEFLRVGRSFPACDANDGADLQTFGVRISLRAVFDAPTVRTLALRIKSEQPGSDPDVGDGEEEREELIF